MAITGEPSFFEQTSDSGTVVSRGFCGVCGSPVLNVNSGYPENYYFHAATLDDPSIFKPTTVVFSDSAQHWDHIDPALK